MTYRRYENPKEFYDAVFPVLTEHEAQNALPLGNVILGKNGGEPDGWRDTRNWYMSAVSDGEGRVLLVAIMTPPFNITLYEAGNHPDGGALACLCANLFAENVPVPGVTSETDLARRFSEAYLPLVGAEARVYKHLRIYTLEKVEEPVPSVGTIRKAAEADLHVLPYWDAAFNAECRLGGTNLEDAYIHVKRLIEKGTLYVLEEGGAPVSMASAQREMVAGRCVGGVYTPPFFRGRGYASSCVAKLSGLILEAGYRYAALFTDLANPISNSIYQKIGYRPICDYDEIAFIGKE